MKNTFIVFFLILAEITFAEQTMIHDAKSEPSEDIGSEQKAIHSINDLSLTNKKLLLLPGVDSVEYSRRLYDNVFDWYMNAESKAQIVLAFVAAFLAFFVSLIFRKPSELKQVVEKFGWETYVFLVIMFICLFSSVYFSFSCIQSRLIPQKEMDSQIAELKINLKDPSTWKPEIIWYFQFINRLPPEKLSDKLLQINNEIEVSALASQISILSKNVETKHIWVNRAFLSGLLMLISFLLSGISFFFGLLSRSCSNNIGGYQGLWIFIE